MSVDEEGVWHDSWVHWTVGALFDSWDSWDEIGGLLLILVGVNGPKMTWQVPQSQETFRVTKQETRKKAPKAALVSAVIVG